MRALIVAAYAGMVLIWSTTWLAIKFSLQGFAPITGVGLRFIAASLFLYALGAATGALRNKRAVQLVPPWRLVLVLAVCMFGLNYVLVYAAETRLSSGLVAVLFGTLPFFVFGFGRLLLAERVTWKTLAGALLALAGVGVISLAGDVRGDVFYTLGAILSSALAAFGNVYLKRWSRIEPFVILPAGMLLAGVANTAIGLLTEPFRFAAALAPAPLIATLYLVIFGSGIAFYLNHWLLQRVDSWIVGMSALMIPVIAVIVGVLAGGEAFGVRDLAGAAFVIGGVWLAIGRTRVPVPTPDLQAA